MKIRGMRINYYIWENQGWVLDYGLNWPAVEIERGTKEAHAWVEEDPYNRRVTFQRVDF